MTETILREKPHAGNPPAREKSLWRSRGALSCGKLGIGAVLWALASASMAAESPSTLIFVNPATSSFWHAAPGNVLTLPIEYPDGATTATLTVSGVGHEASYPGITGETFELTLPAATTPGRLPHLRRGPEKASAEERQPETGRQKGKVKHGQDKA